MSLDTTKAIKKVTYNGTEIPLSGGSSSQIVDVQLDDSRLPYSTYLGKWITDADCTFIGGVPHVQLPVGSVLVVEGADGESMSGYITVEPSSALYGGTYFDTFDMDYGAMFVTVVEGLVIS